MSRILVIDDEDVVRSLVVEILESAGYDVVAVSSAEVALSLLDDGFDLVVSRNGMELPIKKTFEKVKQVIARGPSPPGLDKDYVAQLEGTLLSWEQRGRV